MIEGALARGASGYIAKSIDPADLPYALRVLAEAEAPRAVPFGIGDDADVLASSGLTERELTILRAVARGLPNRAIAKELWVSEQTVKFHLTNAYRKLGVSNRTEAARWVYEHGLASWTGPTAIGSRQ